MGKEVQEMKNDLLEAKKTIRKEKLEIRSKIPFKTQIDFKMHLELELFRSEEWENAEAILLYVDYRGEAPTESIFRRAWMDHKAVYCPRVTGETIMEFIRVDSFEDFALGYRDIKEPAFTPEENPERVFHAEEWREKDLLLLIPGTVFDKKGGRMGYGKGFYDRYLDRFPIKERVIKIGLSYEAQLVEEVPKEPTDYVLDSVFTEKKWYGRKKWQDRRW